MIENPKPVLEPGVVYIADNGRAICLDCAGASAKFTGRDISGQEVVVLDGPVAAELMELTGSSEFGCEAGCLRVNLREIA